MPSPRIQHAVIIGGSIAGLHAARVLADHAERVTLLDKDALDSTGNSRKGTPHARHAHLLLIKGLERMEARFPGLTQRAMGWGAVRVNLGNEVRHYGSAGLLPSYSSGLRALCASRSLLEELTREQLMQQPKVAVRAQTEWMGMNVEKGRVTGVYLRSDARPAGELLEADFVVDCSGRGSPVVRILESLGVPAPPEEVVNPKTAYASRLFQGPRGALGWRMCQILPGQSPRGALVVPVEGDRYIVTLIGQKGDRPPTNEAGFLDFARSLPVPDVADFISRATPISPIWGFHRGESRRRAWHKAASRVEGLVVMGDAACSLNPLYGQGMTTAVLAADTLDEQLRQGNPKSPGFSKAFQKALASTLEGPWSLATGEDRRWTEENAGIGERMSRSWIERVQRGAVRSPVLAEALHRVVQLLDTPASLGSFRVLAELARLGIGAAPEQAPARPDVEPDRGSASAPAMEQRQAG
ncbi:MAG TPA: FAD-dependent monooxygenase [Myxococcota bacterium]|nr:FAD-dependent monooxygenase [Myxococcota bacterium]